MVEFAPSENEREKGKESKREKKLFKTPLLLIQTLYTSFLATMGRANGVFYLCFRARAIIHSRVVHCNNTCNTCNQERNATRCDVLRSNRGNSSTKPRYKHHETGTSKHAQTFLSGLVSYSSVPAVYLYVGRKSMKAFRFKRAGTTVVSAQVGTRDNF